MSAPAVFLLHAQAAMRHYLLNAWLPQFNSALRSRFRRLP